ncbi:MAG: hypothetical protein ACKVOK_04495, partial [Flavobacteriales bacterium]
MKVKLLTMILLVIAGSSMAQSVDQENQEKYWKYRDQLKKRFMKIGKFSGESIPCSVIIPNRQYGEGADQSDGSIIQWRDATVTLGYYFIVLSTEYKLLSENSQDVQPTLNELYYAMQAFNRLDMVAEGYLGGDMDAGVNPSDLNGFFHRDDVRHEMTLNFENDPAIPNGPIQPDVGHPNQMRSDWDGWININDVATDAFRTEPYQPGSESLDQMTSILLGLRFIERMVPNVFVKPTEDDAGFFIHDECLAMIKRVVENLNDTEPNNFGQFSAKEWTLMQGEDETVHNGGSNCVFASYPITEMMKALFDSQESEMIGEPGEVRLQFREKEVCIRIDTDWDSQFGQVSEEFLEGLANLVLFTVGNYMLAEFIAPAVPSIVIPQATVWSGVHCVVGEPDCCEAVDGPVIIEIPNETIRKIWERLESNSFPMHAEGAGTTTFFTGDLIVKFDGLPNTLPPLTPVPVGEKMTDDDNVHIMLELALLGHTWGPEYVKFCSYPSELYHIPLLYDILHNDPINSNTKSQNYFRELLTLAPCAGPWADPYILSHRAEEWASANRLFHPGDRITGAKAPIYGTEENEDNIIGYVPDPEYRGYFPGIDYMLYYNAYHFTWANELPSYQKSTNCNCVEEITSESEMTNTFEVRRKFPDYKAKGIPIESYLAHDLDMTTAEGVLEVRNDLIICRENPALTTTLRIKDGATLNLYNGNKITVREGNKLVIQNGSHITVGISETDPQGDPNSYPAPEIILEANAELVISDSELNSISGIKIRLAEGAKLTVTDSEITLSAASDESGIYCTGCEWAMTNSTFVNEYALDNFSLLSDDAQLLFTDCPDLNFGNMHLTIADNSSLHADNCELTFHESEILTYNNVELRYDNCTLNLNDAGLRSLSTTILYQNNSDFNITNGGYIEMHEPLPQTIVSKYNYGSGDVHLTQSDSKILFDGAQLHIP